MLSRQVSIYSFLTLRLHRAPAVRLIDSSSSRASTPSTNTSSRPSHTPPPHFTTTTNATNVQTPSTSHSRARGHGYITLDPPTLDNLSLSSAPIPLRTWHASGPVFGHPSLRPATFRPSSSPPLSAPSIPSLASASTSQSRDAEMPSRDDDDDDAMDWTPTASPVPVLASRGLLSPRKATDVTTGLEMLLERANIVDLSELRSTGVSSRARRRGGATKSMQTLSWGWVYAFSLVPLVGVLYYHLR